MDGIVYKYTSPNGKVYIGQTCRERGRRNDNYSSRIQMEMVFPGIEKEGFIDYRKHRHIAEEASRVQLSGWK